LFQLFATDVLYTGGKFTAGVIDTGGNLLPVLFTTVLLTMVVHLDLRKSPQIFKKILMPLMIFSGA
jgi:hypothetical protein